MWLCGSDGNAIIEWCDVNPGAAAPILENDDDDDGGGGGEDLSDVH